MPKDRAFSNFPDSGMEALYQSDTQQKIIKLNNDYTPKK